MYLHLVATLFHHHCVSPNETSLRFGVKMGGCASNVTKVTSVHAFSSSFHHCTLRFLSWTPTPVQTEQRFRNDVKICS